MWTGCLIAAVMSSSLGLLFSFRRFMVVSEVGHTHVTCRFIMVFNGYRLPGYYTRLTQYNSAAKKGTECSIHHPSGGTRPSVKTANLQLAPHFICKPFHALTAFSSGHRKVSPVRHMASRITASLRASATLAFLPPFLFFNRMAQLLIG